MGCNRTRVETFLTTHRARERQCRRSAQAQKGAGAPSPERRGLRGLNHSAFAPKTSPKAASNSQLPMREKDMFKRIGLFIATNLAVVLLLSIVCRVLGIDQWAAQRGMGLTGLIVFASLFGMGGAFLSLAISKWMAKMSTGAKVITSPANETERWLVDTVRRHAEKAGIGMPEVAVYDAP